MHQTKKSAMIALVLCLLASHALAGMITKCECGVGLDAPCTSPFGSPQYDVQFDTCLALGVDPDSIGDLACLGVSTKRRGIVAYYSVSCIEGDAEIECAYDELCDFVEDTWLVTNTCPETGFDLFSGTCTNGSQALMPSVVVATLSVLIFMLY